jgi:hypothetical protein
MDYITSVYMPMKTLFRSAITSLSVAILTSVVSAADKPADTPKPGESPIPEEMMKKWEAYKTPGAAHKLLDVFVGEWDVENTMWMGGPDSPATKSKGTARTKWILDGHYQQQEFTGEMMQQPFQGIGLTGYDNFRKKYFNTWIDSMGTGLFTSEGTADDSGKVFTFTGKMDDPMTGEKDKPTKLIIHIVSPDKHTFEMHDLALGEKSKVMEMTYTRKKK